MPFVEPLQLARKTHCDMLSASGIDGGVSGTCLYAAILLHGMVELYCGRGRALIRGGDGEGDGGYVDAAGVSHGHYWVEVIGGDGEPIILDVTADQFGGPAIVQLPLVEASRTYLPGDQATVEQHVLEELQNVGPS